MNYGFMICLGFDYELLLYFQCVWILTFYDLVAFYSLQKIKPKAKVV